jgi:translocation and assembly module TamB
MTAAGALLSQGESVALQEKLKSRLGLDVLDINAGDGDVTSSIITTGKYLTPDLYISLGYSLFDQTNEVKVRYNLAPDWEIESNIGTESGVDLFYKIDIE